MRFEGKTVLVTGAGGFIGSHLTERLVQLGARTRALVEYNSRGSWDWLDDSPLKHEMDVVLGDITDPASVADAMKGVDVVFHLAALIAIPYSYRAPLSYIRTNVEGTHNVLAEAMRANVSKVVHTSTSEVYGTARYAPIDEAHPLQGQSPYSASKIGADMMAEAFQRSFGLPVTTIRPFNTYGPRQSARAVIPTIISQALSGEAVRLGNTNPTRDMNYVADTVDGFLAVAGDAAQPGRVYNIGSGREISIAELARTICGLIGVEVEVTTEQERMRPENSEVDRLLCDATRARTELGWEPKHTLEQGLGHTIEWLERNLHAYRPRQYAL